LAESEQLWAGSFIITTKGILETTVPVLQGRYCKAWETHS
jgi:hypothetical protein